MNNCFVTFVFISQYLRSVAGFIFVLLVFAFMDFFYSTVFYLFAFLQLSCIFVCIYTIYTIYTYTIRLLSHSFTT